MKAYFKILLVLTFLLYGACSNSTSNPNGNNAGANSGTLTSTTTIGGVTSYGNGEASQGGDFLNLIVLCDDLSENIQVAIQQADESTTTATIILRGTSSNKVVSPFAVQNIDNKDFSASYFSLRVTGNQANLVTTVDGQKLEGTLQCVTQ